MTDVPELKLYTVADDAGPLSQQDVQSIVASQQTIQNVGQQKLSGGTFQSANFVTGVQGWQLLPDGNFEGNSGTFRGDLIISGLSRTIGPTSSIQTALDTLHAAGGGNLFLKEGTWTQTTALTGYSSVAIIGISPTSSIIDFNSGSRSLTYAGSGAYTTGTITGISGGVNVTGSGTSWLANVTAGQTLFLDTRSYIIAAVTGNTTLVLAEGYGDNVTFPSSYRIVTQITDVLIKGVGFKNSTTTALILNDCRRITLANVNFLTNSTGYAMTNCSETDISEIEAAANTSDGIQMTNVGLSFWRTVLSTSNTGNGETFSNVKDLYMLACASPGNMGDGVNMTTGVNIQMTIDASGNSGQGVELVSACDNVAFISGRFVGNTSDGLKLTATATNCHIYGSTFTANGGYGVNIANANCSNNILTTNNFATNTPSACSDSGTNTIIRGNSGLSDNTSQGSFGGTGSDGTLSVSSGTTTINLGGARSVVKNYISISITGTATLAFSNPNASGTIIILKSQGGVTLTSSSSPMIDASSMGAAGGALVTGNNGGAGKAGNIGGHGEGYDFETNGGSGGTAASAGGAGGLALSTFVYQTFDINLERYRKLLIGSGGGSGSNGSEGSVSDVNAASGAGGTGGGCLIIECAGTLNFTTTNGISVAGGAGGNSASISGEGGGGGGGSGGYCLVLYNMLTSNSGTINVAGGTGGNKGSNNSDLQAGGGGGGFIVAGSAGTSSVTANAKTGGDGAVGYSTVVKNTSYA